MHDMYAPLRHNSSPALCARLQDIGRAFWEGQGRGKRDRQTRLVRVDGHDVLRSNMYSLEEVRRTA